MPRILALLLSAALGASPMLADPVELYFFANQQAYLVSKIEEGLPVLDTEADLPDYDGPRHGAWWVKGELPLTVEKAIPLVDYQLSRVANSFEERDLPTRYSFALSSGSLLKASPWLKSYDDAFLVVGWMREGRLIKFEVAHATGKFESEYVRPLELSESEAEGMPFAWLVRDGKVLDKEESFPWDALFFESEAMDYNEVAEARDPQGRSALHYASANGLVAAVERLLEANRKLVRDYDDVDGSPLRYAAERGRGVVAQRLLDAKAPLLDGWSDLSSIVRGAAEKGHFEVVKRLVPNRIRGGDLRWHASWAVSDALNRNYEDIAMYLIDLGAEFKVDKSERGALALSKFAAGHPDLGFRLLEKFRLEPTFEEKGYNLLHAVAGYADVGLLEQLRSRGVDLRGSTDSGLLPMDLAVGFGNIDALCWFIDNGGQPADGEEAANPLQRAIAEGQLASVECLIGYGYDVNRELADGLSPLMYAVARRELEIARALQASGGVWLLDSSRMDRIMVRLVELDAGDLLASVIDQGWDESRLLFGKLPLSAVVAFYGDAAESRRVLQSRDWTPVEEGRWFAHLGDVEAGPRLASAFTLKYPLELQERYGSRQIMADVLVSDEGIPLLVAPQGRLPAELLAVVENAIYGLRFEPARDESGPVPVAMPVRLPLESSIDPSKVFSTAEVEEKPSVVRWVDPQYPLQLQIARVKGRVVIEFILLPDGTPYRPRSVEHTHPALAEAAIRSVERSEWRPATKGGVPVACLVRVPVNFTPY